MTGPIGLLLHDDRRHGVARYARDLALAAAHVPLCVRIPEASWTEPGGIGRVHAHFTDRLWGSSPEAASDRLLHVVGTRRLSVTLHDLPQPSDGKGHARRIAAYRRVIDAADQVVVNSHHERSLLAAAAPGSAVPTVIPLPVLPAGTPAAGPPTTAAAVLGYVYPGKGHREVITAIAERGAALEFLALGAPSPGHEVDAADLVQLGRDLGVPVTISGYLSDDRLRSAAASVAVPVVAHQHLSASGSINSWIAAGRRPLALRSRYTEEMAALRPGTLRLVDPGGLASAIADAALDPASTWLRPGTPTTPHLAETLAAYLGLWSGTAAA